MNVVTSAMITSIANSASLMTPFSSARLSTISSVRPRVFISVPITADSRQPSPVTRLASSEPPNLQAIATTVSTSVIRSSSERSSSSTFVRRPVKQKNSGSSSRTTKSSIRCVTSSVRPAWRGMTAPITNAPKMSAMPICSVA